MKSLLLAALVLFSGHAFGQNTGELFEALRESGEKYQIIGTVCEQVAKIKMAQEYQAPEYDVVTGIAYRDDERTIGELDVVVISKRTHKAIVVAEVKCWKNLRGARNKAQDQRSRFQKTIKRGTKIELACTDGSCQYRRGDFDSVEKFLSISQEGGRDAGFEMELPYSLDELMDLRMRLMQCQERNECKRSH